MADLALKSVASVGLATIRVTYTVPPLTASTTGSYDALNKNNYSVFGPGENFIDSVEVVYGDPTSVDLLFAAPLGVGTWTVTVSNVRTAPGGLLTDPKTLALDVVPALSQEPISRGAQNISAEGMLREYLNPYLQGPAWDALISALATGDQYLLDLSRGAADQIHVPSASGAYLDRRLANDGVRRPPAMGMGDEAFRKYGIAIRSTKLTQQVLLEVLEVFFGTDAVRSKSVTTVYEPFTLNDGDQLFVQLDRNRNYSVVFSQGDFADISAATALEVAMAITRSLRAQGALKAFALPYRDEYGNVFVAIYTDTLGLSGTVAITGGLAQDGLRFPAPVDVSSSGNYPISWTITKAAQLGTVRYALNTAAPINLSSVKPGDYVNITAPAFASGNRGCFKIDDVSFSYPGNDSTQPPDQWFEVTNWDGTGEVVVQSAASELQFYSVEASSIHASDSRTAVVSQSEGEIIIRMPATSQAVNRAPKLAAYLQEPTTVDAYSFYREGDGLTTVVTGTYDPGISIPGEDGPVWIVPPSYSGEHGLSPGDQIFIDGAQASMVAPAVTNEDLLSSPAKAKASFMSVVSPIKEDPAALGRYGHTATKLQDGRVLVVGGFQAFILATSLTETCNIYEPYPSLQLSTDVFQQQYERITAATYHSPISEHAAILLDDGQVLVCGGIDSLSPLTDTAACYLYDPNTDTWTATGSMGFPRASVRLSKRQDGTVLATGGLANFTIDTSSEIYDPATGTWNYTNGPLLTGRYYHTQTALNDDGALAVGGQDPSGFATNLCEWYNPGVGEWQYVGSMTYARMNHSAVLLPDGRVLVVGGTGFNPTQSLMPLRLTSCEIYDPQTKKWGPAGDMSVARELPSVWYDSVHNRVYAANGADYEETVDVLDVATMKWSVSYAGMLGTSLFGQFGATTTVLDDGATALLVGGTNLDTGTAPEDNALVIPGHETYMAGGLNGMFTVNTVPDPITFTYYSPTQQHSEIPFGISPAATITAFKAAASAEGMPGPYVFDTTAGPEVTSIEGTLQTAVYKGNRYGTLQLGVGEASAFPDAAGWLCLAFGTAKQVFPVPYLGRIDESTLMMDQGFVMPENVPAGSKVMWVSSRNPYVPEAPETVGSFYLTASNAGRVGASKAIHETVAAGVKLNEEIVYPGDRGLAGEGLPQTDARKLSDKVAIWAGDDVSEELREARDVDLLGDPDPNREYEE